MSFVLFARNCLFEILKKIPLGSANQNSYSSLSHVILIYCWADCVFRLDSQLNLFTCAIIPRVSFREIKK